MASIYIFVEIIHIKQLLCDKCCANCKQVYWLLRILFKNLIKEENIYFWKWNSTEIMTSPKEESVGIVPIFHTGLQSLILVKPHALCISFLWLKFILWYFMNYFRRALKRYILENILSLCGFSRFCFLY